MLESITSVLHQVPELALFLALLRLLRSTNRRVHRLHAVAVRCWRSLTAQGLPGIVAVLPR